MSSEPVKLLRRPLPPKKIPPILKPFPPPILSGMVVDLMPWTERKLPKDSLMERSESSFRGNTPSWDYDPLAFRIAPLTPQLPSYVTLPKIIEYFPCRPLRALPRMPLLDLLQDPPRYAPPPPRFCLDDFLLAGQSQHGTAGADQSLQGLKRAVVSRCNYSKLVGLVLLELHGGRQKEVAKQNLTWEHVAAATARVPQRQIICELTALIRLELQAQSLCRGSCTDELLSHSEEKSVEAWMPRARQDGETHGDLYPGIEVILNSVTTNHFQGSRRTRSPFRQAGDVGVISSSELAILDCLAEGGKALSLKAHFIVQVPDLMPLTQTLLYLNLSFNDLTSLPTQVYELCQLEVLKLRDNPIEEIPAGIERLVRLKTLVLSFCKISSLPSQLYALPCLQYLDVSYNLISSLTNDIKNLRSLEVLNVEGNQLLALPCGMLRLSLSQLRLRWNYTHPRLWQRSARNAPQQLRHSATRALALTRPHRRYARLPEHALLELSRVGVCDCCRGALYGAGLKLIRPCYDVFGLPLVPIMFLSCSPACHWSFRNQTESLTTLLYGD